MRSHSFTEHPCLGQPSICVIAREGPGPASHHLDPRERHIMQQLPGEGGKGHPQHAQHGEVQTADASWMVGVEGLGFTGPAAHHC